MVAGSSRLSFNRLVNRAVGALAGLRAALRSKNLRRVELAWGAAIAAEWAHFVAFGIFAYDEGGTVAVGVAGLVRMLPAALVAPFAASFGDRFRRERFLLAIALVGCGALAGSAAAFFAGSTVLVLRSPPSSAWPRRWRDQRSRRCCRRWRGRPRS